MQISITLCLPIVICDFDPLRVCLSSSEREKASRAETFNIFQLILLFIFISNAIEAHMVCCSWRALAVTHSLWLFVSTSLLCCCEFDKVETAHKGISRFVSSSKRYFFHHFSSFKVRGKILPLPHPHTLSLSILMNPSISAIYLSFVPLHCVYTLSRCCCYVCVSSPNIFTIYKHTFPHPLSLSFLPIGRN